MPFPCAAETSHALGQKLLLLLQRNICPADFGQVLRRLTKGTVLGRLDGVVVQYGRCRFLVTEMAALALNVTWYMLLALGALKIALL